MPPSPDVLITEADLRARVAELGAEIAAALPPEARAEGVVVIGLLKGAVPFMADLSRALSHQGVPVRMDFIRLASYGAGTESSGTVRMEQDLFTEQITGQHVLLVDDIIDTGRTIAFALDHLRAKQPASLRTALFMNKPSRRVVELQIDHVGFEVPNRFVIGYGGDYAEDYRELPYVGALD